MGLQATIKFVVGVVLLLFVASMEIVVFLLTHWPSPWTFKLIFTGTIALGMVGTAIWSQHYEE